MNLFTSRSRPPTVRVELGYDRIPQFTPSHYPARAGFRVGRLDRTRPRLAPLWPSGSRPIRHRLPPTVVDPPTQPANAPPTVGRWRASANLSTPQSVNSQTALFTRGRFPVQVISTTVPGARGDHDAGVDARQDTYDLTITTGARDERAVWRRAHLRQRSRFRPPKNPVSLASLGVRQRHVMRFDARGEPASFGVDGPSAASFSSITERRLSNGSDPGPVPLGPTALLRLCRRRRRGGNPVAPKHGSLRVATCRRKNRLGLPQGTISNSQIVASKRSTRPSRNAAASFPIRTTPCSARRFPQTGRYRVSPRVSVGVARRARRLSTREHVPAPQPLTDGPRPGPHQRV